MPVGSHARIVDGDKEIRGAREVWCTHLRQWKSHFCPFYGRIITHYTSFIVGHMALQWGPSVILYPVNFCPLMFQPAFVISWNEICLRPLESTEQTPLGFEQTSMVSCNSQSELESPASRPSWRSYAGMSKTKGSWHAAREPELYLNQTLGAAGDRKQLIPHL